MSARLRRHMPKILPVAVLAIAALAAFALVKTKPQVEIANPESLAPLVRVVTARATTLQLEVSAQGTVLPRTDTVLVTRIAGAVTRVASSFEPGGFFDKGDVLLELDRRDYELAVRRAEATLAQARLQVVQQEAEAEVASEEWKRLGEEGDAGPLVLREPQVAQARAGLEAARADLERAQLDLERTKIRAPFDGRIRQKRADLGQFLTPGAPVASIHATDYAEVRLPVADDQLAFLELPFLFRSSSRTDEVGPPVRLEAKFAGRAHSWFGTIVRTEGELDPKSRMINLVARVERPYEADDDLDRPPLAVGLFVQARIEGRIVNDVIALPRDTLRQDGRILVVDDDDRLRFRAVEIIRRERDRVVIASGIQAGDLVCVSPLDVVTDGMLVRTVSDDTNIDDGMEDGA